MYVKRFGDYIVVDIAANAFLHHMVRNIVGSLLKIGEGNAPVDWMEILLAKKDRSFAAPTAKPHGLYLVKVTYPDEYEVPAMSKGPLFLSDNLMG